MEKSIIAERATMLVREKGYHKVKIGEIANDLGISHATIYKYYKDKKALLRSVALNKLNEDDKSLRKIVDYSKDSNNLYHYLWMLAHIQRDFYLFDSNLFELSKDFYEHDLIFRNRENIVWRTNLVDLLRDSMCVNKEELNITADTILNAFSVFYIPYFFLQWGTDYYQANFDSLYNLVIKNSDLKVA
ncbi:MAG: TetR/AcrR family transcriptional regulator [Lactobacillus sp.]|nr:MAG: TetR/AcrR family transcriptional regulator [Lactobacillus sp.]